ncbi:ParB/RepB/Spo0J family partition protein [Streptomyces sp. AM 4-1-1]|uniref:ParB/RepB/Spo0J family partition protein n=1 Tax=unclassified Streptomyces TaxID=2593676 RepID=UPI0023B8BCDD|nr:ParB/RepB/Spo0J family partition protein [Streptomyces sp. AM 4-1-1]WEH36422.1 ParB/RepB/Spo0J family partition protein [Streptomyces sp. AM 4-1-1]
MSARTDHEATSDSAGSWAGGPGRPVTADLTPAVKVPIAALSTGDSPRLGGADVEHCRVIAESAADLPPIVVHRATMRVIDGVHRLRAAELRGDEVIAVRFFAGSAQDAYVLSVEANTTHGLPLSKMERMVAADRIMNSHPERSDRSIAALTGLSARTVAALRRRSTGERPRLNTRVGQDGRVRPVNSAEGRRLAGELMASDPNTSLRRIAAVVGLSPATVLDVRRRLDRDEDPVPPSQRTSPAPVARPSRGKATGGQEDLDALLHSLSKDPALRFTETGRLLLRWLHRQAAGTEEQVRLLDKVPAHCAAPVAELVRRCAERWLEMAEQMEQRRRQIV